jgi:hypothetical protein
VAHYYSYIPKGGTEPEHFDVLDEKIAKHLGVPVHPTQWVENWDNIISVLVAAGKTLPEVRADFVSWMELEDYKNPEGQQHLTNLITICDFLDTNYTSRAWRSWGFAY